MLLAIKNTVCDKKNSHVGLLERLVYLFNLTKKGLRFKITLLLAILFIIRLQDTRFIVSQIFRIF